MKTVISVTNGNQWSEKNQTEFLFKKFVESEYQFEMSANGQKTLVTFRKGEWTCLFHGDHRITIADNFEVFGGDDRMSVAFIRTRLDMHQDKAHAGDYIYRTVPANAIWDFAKLCSAGIEEAQTVMFTVELPGRNGLLTDAGTIMVDRSDW